MPSLRVEEARAVLGGDFLGPEDVSQVFGAPPPAQLLCEVPFSRDTLTAARRCGVMLVLRTAQPVDGSALTILQILDRHPQAFDAKLARKAGYLLKDEWGIALEPLAATATCTSGWALVRKEVMEDSCNLPYDEQEAALQRCGALLGVPVRRRTAVEIVYDTVLYFRARTVRLLERSWDWSSSVTLDRAYLNVGGFSSSGMQILGFSRGIRHGRLGVCPTSQPLT